MNNLTFIVLTICLLSQFAPELVQCFSVAAGGNRSEQLFFCEAPGCAANVTVAYCNDELLFSGDHIAQCAGPPPPDSVCQHNGQAFVSTTSGAQCEFEGNGYIETKKCTDLHSSCVFPTDTTPWTPVDGVSIVGGVIDTTPWTPVDRGSIVGGVIDTTPWTPVDRGSIVGGVIGVVILALFLAAAIIYVKRNKDGAP